MTISLSFNVYKSIVCFLREYLNTMVFWLNHLIEHTSCIKLCIAFEGASNIIEIDYKLQPLPIILISYSLTVHLVANPSLRSQVPPKQNMNEQWETHPWSDNWWSALSWQIKCTIHHHGQTTVNDKGVLD